LLGKLKSNLQISYDTWIQCPRVTRIDI